MRIYAALLAVLSLPGFAGAAPTSSTFTTNDPLQVPGSTLSPGTYQLSVEEDSLRDRAVVRITSRDQSTNLLLLAVPSKQLKGEHQGPLIVWTTTEGGKKAVRAWVRPDKKGELEFAYPKDEAVALANQVSERVVAVDPASDKLPALPSLTRDDMKIVNLWLLSRTEASPAEGGSKIAAAHYEPPAEAVATQSTASDAASSATATQTVASAARPTRLPHTAGHDFEFIAAGGLLLLAALSIKAARA